MSDLHSLERRVAQLERNNGTGVIFFLVFLFWAVCSTGVLWEVRQLPIPAKDKFATVVLAPFAAAYIVGQQVAEQVPSMAGEPHP